jgi:predicted alpha/beta-fold hydrolase
MTNSGPAHKPFGVLAKSEFEPPWWAKNRHIQTIWPRFFQRRATLDILPQRLELPDGDFVNLAWTQRPENPKGIIILFHGLEGSVKSHYANDLMAYMHKQGWWSVLMHFRGCGGEHNTLPRAYHSGETEDALFFLEWLQNRFADLPKVAIGFSLGGNMLLKLLGENSQQKILSGAVSVSPPMRLDQCAESINKGFSQLYQRHLMSSMKSNLLAKMAKIDYPDSLGLTPAVANRLKTFEQFDEVVTAPLHGFLGATDYYSKCSAAQFLKDIKTPTLILHSQDDPFMNDKVVPRPDELSSMVRCELSERGGHVGFMQGTPRKPTIWLHQRINDFANQILQNQVIIGNRR